MRIALAVAQQHRPRLRIRIAEAVLERAHRRPAQIERLQERFPLGAGFRLEGGGKKIDQWLLRAARLAFRDFEEFETTESAEQILAEFRFIAGEHDEAAIL